MQLRHFKCWVGTVILLTNSISISSANESPPDKLIDQRWPQCTQRNPIHSPPSILPNNLHLYHTLLPDLCAAVSALLKDYSLSTMEPNQMFSFCLGCISLALRLHYIISLTETHWGPCTRSEFLNSMTPNQATSLGSSDYQKTKHFVSKWGY